MLRRLLVTASAVCLLVPAASAHAQFPGLRISYIQPTGTGGPNDSFEVWMRLTLADGADPITFDGSSGAAPDFGMPAGFIPLIGTPQGGGAPQPFATYGSATTNTSFTCMGTFTSSCTDGPPYDFQFHLNNANPARPSFNFRNSFTLNPGESFEYLFGTFSPSAGPVAPGTYTFAGSNATLNVFGEDATGTPLTAYVEFAGNCTGAADCTFTRTVVGVSAVPEPTTVLLLASGLAGVALAARRRRVVAA